MSSSGSSFVSFFTYLFTSNVKTETIEIKVESSCTTAQQTPTASGFYNDSAAGASLEETFSQRRTLNIRNTLAAALATDERKRDKELQQDFSQIFLEYHNACVQVKSNSGETGSGILFNHSETSQVVLFTAAHVVKNSSSVKIFLETDYRQTENDESVVKATQTEIALRNPEITFIGKEDAAVLCLSKKDSEKILKTVKKFPSPSLKFKDYSRVANMMIHYAAGTNKKVSTGKSEEQGEHYMLEPLKVHIDGGPGASGAPLFNSKGEVLSILKSSDKRHEELRNVVPIETIFGLMVKGKMSGSNRYVEKIFEICEGSKAMKSLLKYTDIRKQDNENLPMLENPTPSLAYLGKLKTSNCSPILHATVFDCLAQGGKHQQTKQWSLNGQVDSDHFPAYKAYRQAYDFPNPKFPKAVTKIVPKDDGKGGRPDDGKGGRPDDGKGGRPDDGKGGRPGENKLPAITIPKVIHTNLATTGSRRASIAFRSRQAMEIASGNIAQAIYLNFNDYSHKGLFKRANYVCTGQAFNSLRKKYFKGFQDALQQHKDLHFIDESDREKLVKHIRHLILNNNIGDNLKENDRIIIRSQL